MNDLIKKALLNNQHYAKNTRIKMVMDYAKEHDIQVKKSDIVKYMKKVKPTKIKKVHSAKYNRKFVFNYRGAWFFDIGFNRGEAVDGLSQWCLFMNANSGWVKVYALKDKSKEEIMTATNTFVNECMSGLKIRTNAYAEEKTVVYPIKKIILDGEKGMKGGKILGITIEKHPVGEAGHRLFARIDAFMSYLRRFAFGIMKEEGIDSKNIPMEIILDFVDNWNLSPINGIKCSRAEMMCDPLLEEAYICAALYNNQDINKELGANITKGMQVKLKKLDRGKLFGNKQANAANEEVGTFTIQAEGDNFVGVDVNDPTHKVKFSPNQIKSTVETNQAYMEEVKKLSEVEDVINIPKKKQYANIANVPFNEHIDAGEDINMDEDNPHKQYILALERVLKKKKAEFSRGLFTSYRPEDMYREIDSEIVKIRLERRKAKNPQIRATPDKPKNKRKPEPEKPALAETITAAEAPAIDDGPRMNKLSPQQEALVEEVTHLYEQGEEINKRKTKKTKDLLFNIAMLHSGKPTRDQAILYDGYDGMITRSMARNAVAYVPRKTYVY